MPKRVSQRKSARAARKGWVTRRANERRARAAENKRDAKREAEKSRIEKLLGEDFDTLAEARNALKTETVPMPSKVDVDSADQYDSYYDQWDDGGVDFVDEGEYEAGVDY